MKFSIIKVPTSTGEKYEVRGSDGIGAERSQWRRRFATKADAKAFVDQEVYKERDDRIKEKQNGGDLLSIRTLRDEYDNWKSTWYPDFAPGWKLNVDRYWRDFTPVIANLRIKELNPALLREIERGLRIKGNSKATIQRKIVWIQSVLNYSVQMERLPYSPIAKFKSARPVQTDLEFWEKDEALSFLKFAAEKYPVGSECHWKYLAYLVALNTALRAGELWALRPSCLKRSYGVIRVSEQLDFASRTFRTLKGKEPRSVPLSKDLDLMLDDYIRTKGLKPNDLLFVSSTGSPVFHHNFLKWNFAPDVREWGGKRIKFHGLRHTAATLMLDARVDIRTVQAILGHKNIETTMRYAHAIGRNIQKAADVYSLTPDTAIQPSPVPPVKIATKENAVIKRRHLKLA